MFRNLFDVKRYLSNKDIRRVNRSRLSGKYSVSLTGEEVDINLTQGLCEVVIVNTALHESRFFVEQSGDRMLMTFLDKKLLEVMT